jgi:glycosyltransferase involved in cell wall biosynthesis
MVDRSHELPSRSQRFTTNGGEYRDRLTCIVVIYGNAFDDPTHNAINALIDAGFSVSVVQLASDDVATSALSPSVVSVEVSGPRNFKKSTPIYKLLRWLRFRVEVRKQLRRLEPRVVITIMLHALSAVPIRSRSNYRKLVSCVYDIPNLESAGKLDYRIIRRGWNRLRQAHIVWSSDIYKARLTREAGNLPSTPLICHNCPPRGYLSTANWPRDGWLRSELRRLGATIDSDGGSILLRAGAIGEFGGIEETLEGMRHLPEDYVFLMMGRPSMEYKEKLLRHVSKHKLESRAFLWDRASNEIWKKALQGADIGHLIHGPFPPGPMTRLFEQNSSLSNLRLFLYMAAGLPIISYDDGRMQEIYDEVPCFHVVRLDNLQQDVLTAWRELGNDEARRKSLGDAGRQAHLEKYYWELQFRPVLDAILPNDFPTNRRPA